MPRSRRGGMLMEMPEFVKSDGVGARGGGTRLEEFGFYAADSFKNLERATANGTDSCHRCYGMGWYAPHMPR